MLDHLPEPLRENAIGAAMVIVGALLGRMMHHARQVQRGHRKPFSSRLLWEIPVALGTGFIADGVAMHMGLEGRQALACIIALSYLGPGTVEAILWRLIDRYAPVRGG